MATHSCVLAWETPWTENPSGYSPSGLKESDRIEYAREGFWGMDMYLVIVNQYQKFRNYGSKTIESLWC